MREVILKLNKLAVMNFDPRTLVASIRIFYSKDNVQEYFDVNHSLATKSEMITEEVIRELKRKGTIEVNTDDILESMYIKKFVNEDKAEERMRLFFAKLYERGRVIAREKNHARYMQLLDEIKHTAIVV